MFKGMFNTSTDRISLGYNAGLTKCNVTLSGASHSVEAGCYK
jgi:hypothetical protein